MTEKIADKSWELFQEIESNGGFYECLRSGFIQDEIQKSRQDKIQAYKKKKETLIGVNKYQPNEKIQNLNFPEGIPLVKIQNYSIPDNEFKDTIEVKKIERLNIEAELQNGDA